MIDLVEKLQVRTLDIRADPKPRLHCFKEARALKAWVRAEEVEDCCALLGLQTLDLSKSLLGQSSLACLGRLRYLRVLVLAGCGIEGKHVAQLTNVPWLTALCLDRNYILDADLNAFGPLVKLRRLGLSGLRRLTDAGLSSLSCLPELESLDLSRTVVGGCRLNELSNLRVLRLSSSLVPRPHLTLPPALRVLDLRCSRVVRQAALQLASMASLEELDVGASDPSDFVTDDDLVALSRVARLRKLSVDCVTSCLMNHFRYSRLTSAELAVAEFQWNSEFSF